MKNIIQEMEYIRSRCESFALAMVITRNGSAPRSAGAKMIIKQNGATVGTMGGGNIESQVKQLGVEMLKKHQAAVIKSYQFSGNDAVAMDAICGGR
ncbi:MAG: XdhC family protein [Caldisericales bacterium]|nr:XdhC family protein [Caldisericales bacterium]